MDVNAIPTESCTDKQKTETSPLSVWLMMLVIYCVYGSYRIGAVGPKQEAKASIKFSPTAVGSTVLLVNFDSDKLRNIKSFINVVVKE